MKEQTVRLSLAAFVLVNSALVACGSSYADQVVLEFRPVLSVLARACTQLDRRPHSSLATGVFDGTATQDGSSHDLCYLAGPAAVARSAISRASVIPNDVASGPTSDEWDIEVWLTPDGQSQLRSLFSLCQQSAPACPKTVGTGAFLIGYRGQMIGGLVPALGDPPVSPLVVGGTGKTTAERIASELNSL